MASNSYYSSQPESPHPVPGTDAYSMHPMNNGYTNVPSRPDEDVINSQVNVSSQEPLRPSNKPSQFNRLKQRKFEKLKRYLRLVQQLSRIVSSLFSFVMFGIMMYTSITYQNTKNTFRDGRTAWPKNAKLWPTIMLLIASGLTLITSIVMVFAYCCCSKRMQRSWKFTIAKYAVHIASWAIVSFLYRYEKSLRGNSNDIWGWTCADEADAIQKQFDGVVNFSALCTTQGNSWIVSLAEIGFKVLFAIGHFILYRKTRDGEKQKLADGLGGATADLVQGIF